MGPWGPMGPMGPMGPWGPMDPKGPMGPCGPMGPKGPMGIWGPMGSWGQMGLRIANFKIIIAGSISNCGAANSLIDCRSTPGGNFILNIGLPEDAKLNLLS